MGVSSVLRTCNAVPLPVKNVRHMTGEPMGSNETTFSNKKRPSNDGLILLAERVKRKTTWVE